MHKIRDEQGSGLDVPRSGGPRTTLGSLAHNYWREPGHGGPSQKEF